MKFLIPSLTFFAISPVLGSLAISPYPNSLVRRTGECYAVSIQYPTPGVDRPCGGGYVIGNCNCCPDGETACLSSAVCTLGLAGKYTCAVSSGSGPLQCAAGSKACGESCIPVGADCCRAGATYCPAPLHCGDRPDGSNACFDSVQAATTSSTSIAEASTSVGGQAGFPSSSILPSSHTTTTTSSISTKSGTPATSGASVPQTTSSSATSVKKGFWGVSDVFVILVIILFWF